MGTSCRESEARGMGVDSHDDSSNSEDVIRPKRWPKGLQSGWRRADGLALKDDDKKEEERGNTFGHLRLLTARI